MIIGEKTIIHVDDDAEDRAFFREVIEDLNSAFRLVQFADSVSALDYFRQLKAADLPSLIILDINMPVIDGKLLMKEIKALPLLSDVPVVLFTTSTSTLDMVFAKKEKVGFYSKPDNVNRFRELVEEIFQLFR